MMSSGVCISFIIGRVSATVLMVSTTLPTMQKPRGVGHMAAQITVIPRAEQLRDWDHKAVADANDKAENQIVDRPGRADRGQRTDTAEPAHDDGIRQRIELLEQVAQHQRQAEQEITLSGLPLVRSLSCFPYPIIYVQNFNCGLYYSTHRYKCKRADHTNFAFFSAKQHRMAKAYFSCSGGRFQVPDRCYFQNAASSDVSACAESTVFSCSQCGGIIRRRVSSGPETVINEQDNAAVLRRADDPACRRKTLFMPGKR